MVSVCLHAGIVSKAVGDFIRKLVGKFDVTVPMIYTSGKE